MKNKNKNASELRKDYVKATNEILYIDNYVHERCVTLLNKFIDINIRIESTNNVISTKAILDDINHFKTEAKINILSAIEKHIESISSKQLNLF